MTLEKALKSLIKHCLPSNQKKQKNKTIQSYFFFVLSVDSNKKSKKMLFLSFTNCRYNMIYYNKM